MSSSNAPAASLADATVPALSRAFTDDRRQLGRILEVLKDSYTIQTEYGVLDRNYPTSELNEVRQRRPGHAGAGRYQEDQSTLCDCTEKHCREGPCTLWMQG